MKTEIDKKNLNNLLIKVMRIQKEYAHEQTGAKTDRREKIKKTVNQVAAEVEAKNGN